MDEQAIDEDVPMDQDPAETAKDADDLAEYNLDDYDNEDDTPGEAYFSYQNLSRNIYV